MDKLSVKQIAVLLIHAFVLWALCGAIMGIGPTMMTMETTLIVHAVGAPIIAAVVTAVYYRFFGYTAPLHTALVFVAFIILVDALVVALLIMRSFEMFQSFIGTWLPFMLIFASSYLTGLWMTGRRDAAVSSA